MNKSVPTDRVYADSPEDLLRWLRSAPPGTMVRVGEIAPILELLATENGSREAPQVTEDEHRSVATWRERLWLVPAQTRLGTVELAEALGRPKSWIYARTKSGAEEPLPHAKLDGALVFRAGEIRAWLEEHEQVVSAGPMMSVPAERRLRLLEE